MSRQAFTDSMTRMEEELGIRLFDRRTNGIVLTEAGKELIRFLKGWLSEWDREKEALTALEKKEPQIIHVGVYFTSLSRHFLERMALYETVVPGCRVEYEDRSPQECFTLLEQGSLDVICGLDHAGDFSGLVRRRLPEEGTQPMLLMYHTHPLARKERVSSADLKGIPMVLVNKTMKSDPVLDSYAVPYGAVPVYVPIRNETYTLNLMKVRGAVGLTSSRVPNRYEEAGFVRRPLDDYPFDVSCYVFYKENAPAFIREFVDYFLKA